MNQEYPLKRKRRKKPGKWILILAVTCILTLSAGWLYASEAVTTYSKDKKSTQAAKATEQETELFNSLEGTKVEDKEEENHKEEWTAPVSEKEKEQFLQSIIDHQQREATRLSKQQSQQTDKSKNPSHPKDKQETATPSKENDHHSHSDKKEAPQEPETTNKNSTPPSTHQEESTKQSPPETNPPQPSNPNPNPNPNTNPPQEEHKLKVAVWFPFWMQTSATNALKNHADVIDSTGFFWYRLTPEGEVTRMKYADHANEEAMRIAKEKGILVIPTIANVEEWSRGEEYKQELNNQIGTPEAREVLTDRLVKWVLDNGFDGLDFNYEVMFAEERDNYASFIELMAQKLHQHNKKITISGWADPHQGEDMARLGKAVDQVRFMSYHVHGEELKSYIERWKQEVPAHKIYVGYHVFSPKQVHGEQGQKLLTYQQVSKILREHQPQIQRNPDGTGTFTYQEEGKTVTVTVRDEQTLSKTVDYVNQHHPDIGGFVSWHIGAENPKTWDVLRENLK
ncbi:glycosyl hydrolase family 18 protein [Desmospora profundinema]|uniref:YD repeat-containing protein n=1 Tax=Desmospora profundinema TaxID=1571184 RepID=A0ABU1IH08_9BACL|nr:glycosyl hydrolase family 18 protein [Desmospora profundinema]MDR6224060.1 YD repeat-containing protein [Desmospora profundinema]